MFFLDDVLIGLPEKGLMGIFKRIAEMAEEEVTDESKIREELLLNQTLYETDEITEEEYEQREAELLDRLSLVREAE